MSLYLPEKGDKWAQSSKSDRTLSVIKPSNLPHNNIGLNEYKKKVLSLGSLGKSQTQRINSSGILRNEWMANSSIKENIYSDYIDDKENDLVRSVERSLNDWEESLDMLSKKGLSLSNDIDFSLIGKL